MCSEVCATCPQLARPFFCCAVESADLGLDDGVMLPSKGQIDEGRPGPPLIRSRTAKSVAGMELVGVWVKAGAEHGLRWGCPCAISSIHCQRRLSAARLFVQRQKFLSRKGKAQAAHGGLEQVVVEAVDHFNGVEQHNAPA